MVERAGFTLGPSDSLSGAFPSSLIGAGWKEEGQTHLAGKHENLQLFLFSHRGSCGGRRNKIKQMKGVVELRKNNLFFMSLLTFVKLSKQKFMPFICICMH